ncbi:hypothetical protein [Phytohabitans aurantiacus]|uniref:Peptidase inhibitor family I36 n=1 Tax=Phytohabitans aurantiacus TaxID=3016789 RepID=A0ABQ5QME0_9ACTN|nr:hypothetical protein [Phytohabitans aurantiacus]GLH95404.1 hypothetical protein Pa4123_06760 [Phytohabitans aurantiacus]
MRKVKAAVAGAVIGLAVLLTPAAAQAEDNGNGNSTCDRYEICFRALESHTRFSVNWNFSHSFYYSYGAHSLIRVYNNDHAWSGTLGNKAIGFWNRDSECRVQILDYDTYGYEWFYADLPRDYRGDAGYSMNDAHKRCNRW